ncbi:hypothetical protein FBY34_5546 [Streptomyces sp. SLBN-115]|nr:hypothetical protein FBY34_5546 [Streptomyces sp. SLBN-115]
MRIEVGYLAYPSNFAALVRSAVGRPGAPTRTTVEPAALQHAVAEAVPGVDVPDVIVDAVCALRAALPRKELIASDRGADALVGDVVGHAVQAASRWREPRTRRTGR